MEKVDIIIVGGGLSGLSCAYELADSGMTVLVLERGDFSGSKNVTGGRIYLSPIRNFLPDLWKEAPLERHVTKEILTLMGDTNSTTFELYSDRFNREPYPSYTILRAKFDRWFADIVSEKGIFVIPQKTVDDLVKEGEKIIGVRAGEEEIGADCVVAADGTLSFLAEKAMLRPPFQPRHFALGFKEVIQFDPKIIEDRFRLKVWGSDLIIDNSTLPFLTEFFSQLLKNILIVIVVSSIKKLTHSKSNTAWGLG